MERMQDVPKNMSDEEAARWFEADGAVTVVAEPRWVSIQTSLGGVLFDPRTIRGVEMFALSLKFVNDVGNTYNIHFQHKGQSKSTLYKVVNFLGLGDIANG